MGGQKKPIYIYICWGCLKRRAWTAWQERGSVFKEVAGWLISQCTLWYKWLIRVQLPSTYTQEQLLLDKGNIATSEKLKKWKYLDKLKPVTSVEVSLLIGPNCVCVLEPREVISSQNGDPTFETLLGWWVVGPMINQTKASKFNCNRIMFTSADTVKPGSHYFTVPTKVRETFIKSMLKKIYEHDIVEPELQHSVNNKINLNYDNLSKNDKRFLELMEREAVRTDGYYQLPLPLKDKKLVLPNNRMAAMKHMQSLKKRFERDEQFYSQYSHLA